ncbi:hypothetical protein [uncultured Nitrospira sp.]|uniref:hypothetical protein n=1 Tax=uncultured Nitrospira sp. TaxID=157176 RepID=UPI003140AEE3
MKTPSRHKIASLGGILLMGALLCGAPSATVLLTGGLLGAAQGPLALEDEPPAQSTPSTGTGGETGTATGEQEPASPATAPTIDEEAVPLAEGTDIQERGVLPGLVAPGATLQITAPTPSLTAIRNAIRVTSKSVSVNLRIPENLPVTVPVEVSVAYLSPAQTQRLTRTYSPTTGLTLLYREAEGDGKPRAITLDITVRELVPNGKSFSISKQLAITPLYDVSITNMRFTMSSFCDRLGKNDITLIWLSPDGRQNELKFDAGTHEEKVISQFSWGRRGISTEANLKEPSIQFFERDLIPDASFNPMRVGAPLVPGLARQIFDFVLNEKATGPPGQAFFSANCQTQIKYLITRKLMTFDKF